jgi:hypothetical protein
MPELKLRPPRGGVCPKVRYAALPLLLRLTLGLRMREDCCLPGDITVTKVFTGFLIGRALQRKGPGPWWEYVRIVTTFRQAALQSHRLARAAKVRAWWHKGGDEYDRMPKWVRRPRRVKPRPRHR